MYWQCLKAPKSSLPVLRIFPLARGSVLADLLNSMRDVYLTFFVCFFKDDFLGISALLDSRQWRVTGRMMEREKA